MLIKQAGVVARPMSNTKQPARARPANTATLRDAPDIRGSLPSDTLTSSAGRRSRSSKALITHSPKLSAIASTAGGVRSTVRPFSPSNATPRTSDPFWSLLILFISSSTTTSLYFTVLEDLTHMTLLDRDENEKLSVFCDASLAGNGEKLGFRALPRKGIGDVEVEAMDFCSSWRSWFV